MTTPAHVARVLAALAERGTEATQNGNPTVWHAACPQCSGELILRDVDWDETTGERKVSLFCQLHGDDEILEALGLRERDLFLLEPGRPGDTKLPKSLVIRASSVKSRAIRWAWKGRLAIGYLVVSTGIEGLGKSVFAAWMLARLSCGELEGEWSGEPVDVLVLAGEDGIADTWRPRLELARADLDRVSFLNFDQLGPDWNLRDGIDQLAAAVREVNAKVIFIDAALDHMPAPRAGESINSPTFVRQAFAPLRALVRADELVAVFSMHPPKARSADFRDLVQASQAFSAIPRIGLLFAYHPDDPDDDPQRRRVLIRGKGNLGRDPGALEFKVIGRSYKHDDGTTTDREMVASVAPSRITMADLAPDRALGSREPTKAEQAADIIRDALDDGEWHLVAPITEQLLAAGLASKSVRTTAERQVGVYRRKRPGEIKGPWEVRLKTPSVDGPLDPSIPRARCLSDDGPLESSPSIVNEYGKGPRVHESSNDELEMAKGPSEEGYVRARTREVRCCCVDGGDGETGDGRCARCWGQLETDDELQARIDSETAGDEGIPF